MFSTTAELVKKVDAVVLCQQAKEVCEHRYDMTHPSRDILIHSLLTHDCSEVLQAARVNGHVIVAFSQSAYLGHKDIVSAFLTSGIPIEVTDGGDTALMRAVLGGQESIARLLLEHGANVNGNIMLGRIYLVAAARYNNEGIVRVLLEYGADVNLQITNKWTALMYACQNTAPTLVQLLLDHGASVDIQNNRGQTAMEVTESEDIRNILCNHVTSHPFLLK